MHVGHERPGVDFDVVCPIAVALIADIADFQKILARVLEAVTQKWIARERVVRSRQGGAAGIADSDQGVGVLLEVVDFIFQPHRADVEVERSPRLDLELVKIHILGLVDQSADSRR